MVQKSFFQRPRGVAIKSVRRLNGVGGQPVGNRIGMHTGRFGVLSLRLERCAVTASKSCGPVLVWRRSCPRSLWLCILPFGGRFGSEKFFPATARGGHQVGEALERRWRATRWKPNRYACGPIRRPIASAWALCRHVFKIMRARFGLASVLSALALIMYLAVWGSLWFRKVFSATARGGHQVGEALERRWWATRWKPNRYACGPIRRPIASAWALCRHGFKIMRARFGLASVLSALALVLYLAVWGPLWFRKVFSSDRAGWPSSR